MMPFSHEQFIAVFAEYNGAIWPAQLVGYVIGIAISVVSASRFRIRDMWVAAGLSLMWIWTGAVYHIIFFSRINPLAVAFGVFFILQGLLLMLAAATRRLRFGEGGRVAWHAAVGWLLIAYSALLYPAIGLANGVVYPGAPVFGVTPCPVTLFTWGLLLTARTVPWWLVAIPFTWALIGGSAAFLLHVPQDWLLFASATIAFLVPRQSVGVPHRD